MGSADSKVVAEKVVTNTLWEGLFASGQYADTLLIRNSLNILVAKVFTNGSLTISLLLLLFHNSSDGCNTN